MGVNASDELTGANVTAEFGGPVPAVGGHFAENTQSIVWDSGDIVSETVLDPNSRRGVRKYLTKLDAALLRDLGYDLLDTLAAPILAGDYNGNDIVDAADYTVWRDNLGTNGTPGSVLGDGTTTGDLLGTPDGLVDQWDYDFWVQEFGNMAPGSGSGSASQQAVPEPAAAQLFVLAVALLSCVERSSFLKRR